MILPEESYWISIDPKSGGWTYDARSMIPFLFSTTCSAHSSPSTLPPCKSTSRRVSPPLDLLNDPSPWSDDREIRLRSLAGANANNLFPPERRMTLIWLSISCDLSNEQFRLTSRSLGGSVATMRTSRLIDLRPLLRHRMQIRSNRSTVPAIVKPSSKLLVDSCRPWQKRCT
jgi:hypothetical protein